MNWASLLDHKPKEGLEEAEGLLAAEGFRVEPIAVSVPDTKVRGKEIALRGWYLPRRDCVQTDCCVLLVHGFATTRAGLIPWIRLLGGAGWNLAAFDLRSNNGSGSASGGHCTFGVREVPDVVLQVRRLREEFGQRRIVLFGHSLGGAIALLALGHLARELPAGVIAASAYGDLTRATHVYLKKRTHGLGVRWWRAWIIRRMEARLGVSLSRLSPLIALGNMKAIPPCLFVYGTEDRLVPMDEARRMVSAAGPGARLVEIPGGRHANLAECGADGLQKEILAFLEACALNQSGDDVKTASPGGVHP